MALPATAECLRLRRHFSAVLAELQRAAPPSGASPHQRAETIRELARYARAGRFPRHGGTGAPRPVFVDHLGTRCAMAHLLEWNGDGQAVRQVAATRNHAYVPELAASPEVADAIRRLGVSEAEAARIQPTYQSGPSTGVEIVAPFPSVWLAVLAACCVAAIGVLVLFRPLSWSEQRVAERRRRRALAETSTPQEEPGPAGAPGQTPWRTPHVPPPAGPPPASPRPARAVSASGARRQR